MKSIDARSVIIGLALGAGAILALGQKSNEQVGRYQVTGVGCGGIGYGLVIDTTTGVTKVVGDASGHNNGLNKPFELIP